MKLLCLPSLVVFYLSLTEAADFTHFPVVNSRTDPVRTARKGVPAPARPPGNRERVREDARALQESERNQNVLQQVTTTTESNRVNRKRNKSRNRSNKRKIEKKTEVAVTPVRQRTRTRTETQRPTIGSKTLASIGRENTASTGAQTVVKPPFKKTGSIFTANTIPHSTPALELNPVIQSEKASKTFSQSLIELFHPTAPSATNQVPELRQQEEFTEAPFQPPKESIPRFHNRPSPLRVKTKHEPLPFQSKSSQAQPFSSQLLQAQPVKVRTTPIQGQLNQAEAFQPQFLQSQQVQAELIKPQPFQAQSLQLQPFQGQQFNSGVRPAAFQAQSFESEPVQPQQVQARLIQRQPVQFQARTLQLQPFQEQQFNSEVPAPVFQEKPSLFSHPIEIPQQEGAGASFSFEAVVG